MLVLSGSVFCLYVPYLHKDLFVISIKWIGILKFSYNSIQLHCSLWRRDFSPMFFVAVDATCGRLAAPDGLRSAKSWSVKALIAHQNKARVPAATAASFYRINCELQGQQIINVVYFQPVWFHVHVLSWHEIDWISCIVITIFFSYLTWAHSLSSITPMNAV